jgi:hypothetical protein
VPQLRFRNFSNLAFLQSIDKPRFLSRLLAEYVEYFSRHGVNVSALANDDACDRQLLAVFTRPDGEMPGKLLEALYVLDEVADEAGHERILEEAKRLRIDLSELADDLSPADFAIAVSLDNPRLIRICREKTVCRRAKRYYEFRSRDRRRLSISGVRKKIIKMQNYLAPWFEKRKRTRTCEIFVYQENDGVRCLITHGNLYRTDASITRKLERSRIGYWPQRHDSLIYDKRTGILKIHAQFEAERNAYRETFGKILFDDPTYFQEGQIYSLQALHTNGGVLSVVDGMKSARLTEVWITTDDDQCRRQKCTGHDLTKPVAGCGRFNFRSRTRWPGDRGISAGERDCGDGG